MTWRASIIGFIGVVRLHLLVAAEVGGFFLAPYRPDGTQIDDGVTYSV